MNLLDLAILIIVILIAVRGFLRGIIQEAATLIGIIASFLLAFYYYNDLARFLLRYFQDYRVTVYFFSFLILLGLSFFFVPRPWPPDKKDGSFHLPRLGGSGFRWIIRPAQGGGGGLFLDRPADHPASQAAFARQPVPSLSLGDLREPTKSPS